MVGIMTQVYAYITSGFGHGNFKRSIFVAKCANTNQRMAEFQGHATLQ
jgi:hypothetical protein